MEKSNFHSEIIFSKRVSEKRIQLAYQLFGIKTVNRIIGIALFLLGGNREMISEFLKIPVGTFFSFLTRFHKEGISAFWDQREKQIPKTSEIVPLKLELVFEERRINIEVLSDGKLVLTQPVSVSIEKGFSLQDTFGDSWYLWLIGALNIILIAIIIVVAVRILRK